MPKSFIDDKFVSIVILSLLSICHFCFINFALKILESKYLKKYILIISLNFILKKFVKVSNNNFILIFYYFVENYINIICVMEENMKCNY